MEQATEVAKPEVRAGSSTSQVPVTPVVPQTPRQTPSTGVTYRFRDHQKPKMKPIAPRMMKRAIDPLVMAKVSPLLRNRHKRQKRHYRRFLSTR